MGGTFNHDESFRKACSPKNCWEFCLTIAVFVALGVLQGVAAATGSLSASLQVDSPTYDVSDAMLVNNGSTPVQVLPWNAPLEGKFTAPILKVQSNGQETPYIGPGQATRLYDERNEHAQQRPCFG